MSKTIRCCRCGQDLKGKYAIPVLDVLSLDFKDGFLCEKAECVIEFLEEECTPVMVDDDFIKENKEFID